MNFGRKNALNEKKKFLQYFPIEFFKFFLLQRADKSLHKSLSARSSFFTFVFNSTWQYNFPFSEWSNLINVYSPVIITSMPLGVERRIWLLLIYLSRWLILPTNHLIRVRQNIPAMARSFLRWVWGFSNVSPFLIYFVAQISNL